MIAIDSNVIIRFLLNDDKELSPKARKIFEKIEKGNHSTFLSSVILAEVVYVLLKVYKINRLDIVQKLDPIVSMDKIAMSNKSIVRKVFERFIEKNVDFEDAYLVTLMEKKGIKEVYSFDRTDFKKFPQIKRLEK